MVKRLLRGISYLCLHPHRMVLLIFVIVLGIPFLLAGNLGFDPNFLKLFPAEKGPIKIYLENPKKAEIFDPLFHLLEERHGGR